MTYREISEVIPHRPPFLFLDEILFSEGDTTRAAYTFRPDSPVFSGHFPENPVVPGALLMEALAQAGAYNILSRPENAGKIAVLLRVNNARFRKPVFPGDRVELFVNRVRGISTIEECRAEATVSGELRLECEIMCALVDRLTYKK
jgi:3-hydroxyacyl-[acyl-carrier-protein] dehydratase